MSPLSLRARLVLGVLALGAVGLLTADAVTYTSLRSFLVGRVDAGLEADHQGAQQVGLGRLGGPHGGPDGQGAGGAPAGGAATGNDFVEVRSASGAVLFSANVHPAFKQPAPSPPLLPAAFAIPAHANDGPDRTVYLTVPATDGSGSWRVRASIDPGSTTTLILATSLNGVSSTLRRLELIELFVTLGVLAGIAALGLWIVRLGLRPLTEIAGTADMISEGTLSRRVERAEHRTEIGRLGLALNTMLDRLEASDSRLRRFVADASHELRTPLSAVRAYAELFSRGADRRPDDLARAMAGISRESERMSLLVEDLLLLARLDEGVPLEREAVALDALATEAVETARTVDPSRRIEVATEPVVVLGDRVRLRQILDNLLANVRAHTPPETSARVVVSRSGSEALVEVSDAGPGIDAADLPRLFERFYRPDGHRSRASGGSGLGLSIVAAIAAAHHGSANVSSEAGTGTRIEIRLPLAAEEAGGRARRPPAALHPLGSRDADEVE